MSNGKRTAELAGLVGGAWGAVREQRPWRGLREFLDQFIATARLQELEQRRSSCRVGQSILGQPPGAQKR